MELLDKNIKYLLAVSGGPDSMALLHMCLTQGLDIGVCHVNYRKRENAFKEMDGVKSYCIRNKIPFYCLNEEYNYKGNFQAFAREYRYDFFLEISNKFNYLCVLTGHNQDDHIETYLMQKDKNREGSYFGINKISYYNGLKVYRPLLDYTKQELLDYCKENNVKYFIDESNLSDDFTRNKIRHAVIEKLNDETRVKILKEIDERNLSKKMLENDISRYINSSTIDLEVFNFFCEIEKMSFLRMWFKKHISDESYSNAFLYEVIKAIESDNNFEMDIENFKLIKSYKVCEIVGSEEIFYSFDIISNRAMKTKYFSISDVGKTIEGITVNNDEWPLKIRSFQNGDSIKLRFGTKKINRWFIDRKIPMSQRKLWPVVLNNKGTIIMVPGIGCDISHYTIKPNIFVIK